MTDPTNINRTSPGVFRQPTQPVENPLTPAVTNPAIAEVIPPQIGVPAMPYSAPAAVAAAVAPVPYNSVVLAKNPAIFWTLGDAPGSLTAADLSGNGRTGTVTNPVTFGAAGVVPDGSTSMSVNTATPSGASVARNGVIGVGAGALSMEFWLVPQALAGGEQDGLLGLSIGGGVNGFSLGVDGTTGNFIWSTLIGGVPGASFSGGPFVAGQIYHLVATFNGVNAVECYLNGASAGSFVSAVPLGAWDYFGTGADLAFSGTRGRFQKIAAYPTALTPAQVLSNYTAGIG